MRNRAANLFGESHRPVGGSRLLTRIDRSVGLRMCCLWGLFLLPMMAICLRLYYVQVALPERYLAEFEKTTERLEEIPTTIGRILSSDGQVLAQDREQYQLAVHFRWLEDPPHPDWIRRQVASRLQRKQRRNPQLVAQETQRFLEFRTDYWNRLADLTGVSSETLWKKRSAIQAQIEHIREAVQRKHPQRTSRPTRSVASNVWQTIVETLTTSPTGEPDYPLVLQEETAYHPFLSTLTREAALEIQAHPESFPGLRVDCTSRRDYPQGDLASHVIGYRSRLTADQIRERLQSLPAGDPLNYREGDLQGQAGVEKFYESRLRGLRGSKKLIFNRRGEILREEVLREPRPGRDLELTLHVPLQREAEKLLDAALDVSEVQKDPSNKNSTNPNTVPVGGVAAIMDLRSGELLAAASAPHFDLGLLTQGNAERWNDILQDPRHPLFPRLTQMQIPAGSVFKIVTAVGLMHLESFNPDRQLFCQGYLSSPDRMRCLIFAHSGVGHSEVDLSQALAQSCNVYFFKWARPLGGRSLAQWGERLGFGMRTGIDLPGEEPGHLPFRRTKTGATERGDPLGLAIGQSTLLVTPLQVLRMMAAVANGGQLVTPHVLRGEGPRIVSRIEQDEGDATRPATFARTPVPGLHAENLHRVREGLELVVSHPQGTGYKTVRMSGIRIAGKTGTAEVAGRPDHAWFVGYVPADRPRYAILTVLEHGGSGGRAAGPIARELVRALIDQRFLKPLTAPEPTTTAENAP